MGKCGSVMSNTLEEREKQLTKTVEIWSQKSEKKEKKFYKMMKVFAL